MKTKSLFRFKKFDIRQEFAAMKVGTDAVLLGAWTNPTGKNKILDIGAGTGVISLMLAQKGVATIDAIEIDSNAQKDCIFNFQQSTWKDSLTLFPYSLNKFLTTKSDNQYDLVVSNPPYFSDNKNNSARGIARNQIELSFQDLIQSSYKLTNSNGELAVIIPFQSLTEFRKIALENNWFISRISNVKGKKHGKISRSLILLKKTECKTIENEICIELEERHHYSEEYKKLLKDYLIIF